MSEEVDPMCHQWKMIQRSFVDQVKSIYGEQSVIAYQYTRADQTFILHIGGSEGISISP